MTDDQVLFAYRIREAEETLHDAEEARTPGCEDIISRIRVSFFRLLVQAVEAVPLPDSSYETAATDLIPHLTPRPI